MFFLLLTFNFTKLLEMIFRKKFELFSTVRNLNVNNLILDWNDNKLSKVKIKHFSAFSTQFFYAFVCPPYYCACSSKPSYNTKKKYRQNFEISCQKFYHHFFPKTKNFGTPDFSWGELSPLRHRLFPHFFPHLPAWPTSWDPPIPCVPSVFWR